MSSGRTDPPSFPLAPGSVLIDANLLFVVVVQSTNLLDSPGVKGCSEFDVVDLAAIEGFLADRTVVATTPHVLAEVSNLIGRYREDLRGPLRRVLHGMALTRVGEISAPATEAMLDPAYERLGLTDACLLSLATSRSTVLTNDRDLHDSLLKRGFDSVHYDQMLRPHRQR